MKNVCKASLLALILVGAGFAQQEVSPDRFEDGTKQPVNTKHVAVAKQNGKHLAQVRHHVSKPANKPVLSARTISGN